MAEEKIEHCNSCGWEGLESELRKGEGVPHENTLFCPKCGMAHKLIKTPKKESPLLLIILQTLGFR